MGKSPTSLKHGTAGVQHCKQCNAELVPQARFCSVCGAIAKPVDAQKILPALEEYDVVPKWQSIGKSVSLQSEEDETSSASQVTPKDETPEHARLKDAAVQNLAVPSPQDRADEEEAEDEKTYTQPHRAVIANIGRRPEPKAAAVSTPNRQKASASVDKSTGTAGYAIEDRDTMRLGSYPPVPRQLLHELATFRTPAVEKLSVESQPTSALPQVAEGRDMGQTQRIPAIAAVGRKAAAMAVEQRDTQRSAAATISARGQLEGTPLANFAPGLWPLIIIVAAIATALLVYVAPGLPVRPYVVLAFLILCPGMALIRLLHLRDVAVEWTLAIALSIVLDALIPTAQLYAHLWSPDISLAIILLITVVAALAQFIHPGSMQRRSNRPELSGNAGN